MKLVYSLFLIIFLSSVCFSGQENTNLAEGGTLRALDKVTGIARDIYLRQGETLKLGKLIIILGECRYPISNPVGDAFVHITVVDQKGEETYFRGWMVASSPALNALDHVRYDVWPLRCSNSSVATE